jgi:hypothetical protein
MNAYLQDTDFPAVRRVMGAERTRLDDDSVERLLTELFPDSEPEDVEDFMGSLQSFAKQAAPVAQKALPGVVSGAAQGAAIGGPWGALIGAAAGGASSALSSPKPGSSAPAPPVAAPIAAPAPAPIAAPSTTTPAGVAATPPAQLLALLSRPETMQALLALLLSGSGRSSVAVGDKQVPAVAFANAIAETAALVAETAAPAHPSASDYLFDAEGLARTDVANPSARAALLLSDLAEVAAAEAQDERWVREEEAAITYDEATAFRDPLDTYEATLRGGWAHER